MSSIVIREFEYIGSRGELEKEVTNAVNFVLLNAGGPLDEAFGDKVWDLTNELFSGFSRGRDFGMWAFQVWDSVLNLGYHYLKKYGREHDETYLFDRREGYGTDSERLIYYSIDRETEETEEPEPSEEPEIKGSENNPFPVPEGVTNPVNDPSLGGGDLDPGPIPTPPEFNPLDPWPDINLLPKRSRQPGVEEPARSPDNILNPNPEPVIRPPGPDTPRTPPEPPGRLPVINLPLPEPEEPENGETPEEPEEPEPGDPLDDDIPDSDSLSDDILELLRAILEEIRYQGNATRSTLLESIGTVNDQLELIAGEIESVEQTIQVQTESLLDAQETQTESIVEAIQDWINDEVRYQEIQITGLLEFLESYWDKLGETIQTVHDSVNGFFVPWFDRLCTTQERTTEILNEARQHGREWLDGYTERETAIKKEAAKHTFGLLDDWLLVDLDELQSWICQFLKLMETIRDNCDILKDQK